jgi:hypothetical protein
VVVRQPEKVVFRREFAENHAMSIGLRTPSVASPAPLVPPRVDGEHLGRDEFERRFDATPGLTKAELIEGVVHMAPAVRAENHGGR